MIDEKNQVVWKELEAIHPYYSDIDEWGKPHKNAEAFHEYQRRWLRAHTWITKKIVADPGLLLGMKDGDNFIGYVKVRIKVWWVNITKRLRRS